MKIKTIQTLLSVHLKTL